MKKLMVAAFAVAFAAVAQAASVSWGGAFATVDGGDTLAAGTQFALLYSTEAFTGAATTLDSFAAGGVADNGGTILQTYAVNGSDSENWSFTSLFDNTGKDVNGYYAILALNDAGDKATYMDMGSISGTTATSPTTNVVLNDMWMEGDAYLTSNGYTVTVGEVVPEPTSGLLLLIGMAGLALRRRRA